MTLEKLKEIVHGYIGQARTKAAILEIEKWARTNHNAPLQSTIAQLKGDLAVLDREKMLGLLSHSEAGLRQNKLTHSILFLLNSDMMYNDGQSNSQLPAASSSASTNSSPTTERLKILMLTSNPAQTVQLDLNREYAVIAHKLQQKRDAFSIIRQKAISGTEFKESTQRERPDILHFSGHGTGGERAGIIVQNEDKNGKALLSVDGLKSLFKFFKKRLGIKVVLLNACYTEKQAAAIAQYVEYVIGTNVSITDNAASAFSSGFYFQLAEDGTMDIEDAFDSGRTEAVMKGAAEKNFVIYRNGELIEID